MLLTLGKRSIRIFRSNGSWAQQTTRRISITYRGKPISQEELFQYTNGRFLINEEYQRDRRYVKFDVDKLCDVAASAGDDKSPISAIEKIEGSFSKALLMRKENRTELIAKIPCPNRGPSKYTTESEVAVLQYIQTHTTIPVPKVLGWNSDVTNPVGAEYILMEKAAGIQLYKKWEDMDQSSRLALTQNLAILEHQIASIHFPAIGNLYLRQSLAGQVNYTPLNSTIDPSGLYCIGPSCDRSWIEDPHAKKLGHNIDSGPWPSLSTMGIAIAKREIFRISHTPKSNARGYHRGAPSEQISLLEAAIDVMKILELHPTVAYFSKPVLWHTDLHMGNIYVADEDSSQILSFIDWQSIAVAPIFLQARYPIFLEPPEDYIYGPVKPSLPKDFDELSTEDQATAKDKKKQAVSTKGYELCSILKNSYASKAREVPRVVRELFIRCGETWDEGAIPLRACLIEFFKTWQDHEFPVSCPMTFTKAEIEKHEREFEEYSEWQRVQELVRNCLDTDMEGWIAPEVDFEEKRRENKEMLDFFLAQKGGDKPQEEARNIWPFLNDAE